jgi:hypothetical protein
MECQPPNSALKTSGIETRSPGKGKNVFVGHALVVPTDPRSWSESESEYGNDVVTRR